MIFLLLVSLLSSQTLSKSQTDVKDIQKLIDTVGARETLSRMFDDDILMESVSHGIGTGSAEWLKIASQLRPVSDAGLSEMLDIAVQEALPKNPVGVLQLVEAAVFSASGACGMYGFGQIEDDRPTATILRLVDARISAVSRVRQKDVAKSRDACLVELRQMRQILQVKLSLR